MAINVNVANAQVGQLSSYANQLKNAITIRAISKNTYIKRAVNRLFIYFKRANFVDFRSYIYERKKPHENVSEVKMLNCIDIFNIIIKIISEAVYL